MARQANCTNIGNCSKADSREIISLPDSAELKCPECDKPLRLKQTKSRSRLPLMVPLLIGIVLFLILGVALAIHRPQSHNSGGVPATAIMTVPSAINSLPSAQKPLVATASNDSPNVPFAIDPQEPTTVTNFGVPLLTELVSYGHNSPKVRAEKIASRLNDCYLNDLKPPRTVKNLRQGNLIGDSSGTKYVFFGYLHPGGSHDTADIVATIDPDTAAHCQVSPVVLACWWRDIIRDWLLINNGQSPQFTVVYTPVMKDFYNAIPPSSMDTTDQSNRFRKAVDTLINSNDEYEQLRILSTTVPKNYIARPDNYSPALNDDGGPTTSG